MTKMHDKEQAMKFAADWIEAWNAHDLEAIMSHYDDKVVLISPVAQKIMKIPSGMVKGKEALRVYFTKGLAVRPDLRFEFIDVMWGINSLVVYYKNQKDAKAGEFMELSPAGKIIRVVANYNG
jgi:ketosteroid isomerase-like protein